MKRIIQSIFLTFLLGINVAGAGHTTARLLLSNSEARPGESVEAVLELSMDKGWHTYWRNGGDAGIATSVAWKLPPGITATELLWPVPEKLTITKLTAYVFEGRVLLPFSIQVASTAKAGPVSLKGKVSWLECTDETCVPGGGPVEAELTIGLESKQNVEMGAIQEALQRIPRPDPSLNATAVWGDMVKTNERTLIIEWIPKSTPHKPDFYSYESGDNYTVDSATEVLQADTKLVRIKKKVRLDEKDWPGEIAGLAFNSSEGAERTATEVRLKIGTEAGSASRPIKTAAAAPPKTPTAPVVASISLLAALGLAFLGGMILNIMPCVLPVIALKILGFVNQTREAPGRARKLGLMYGLGVMVSFWTLALIVIGIQRAGNLASWGMQFQNPIFLMAITTLVVLVSLNLFGLFEVYLGGGTMTAASDLASREGASGAFFNGVLATILATPCTAPALASAIGFAFAQPPLVILLIFTTVALGLAFPYVILAFKPNWLRFLPKPGNWMVKFKVGMGFPMLATAVWLFWLSSSLLGRVGVLWFGIFLVSLGFSVWVWGEFVQRGRTRKRLAMVISMASVVGAYFFTLEHELNWRHLESAEPDGPVIEAGGIRWQKWSPEAVEEARGAGHPVLVDFTADWCLSCQVNKASSIEIDAVRKKLMEINAVALLADYTRVNGRITEELRKYQRAGVPLVLVFPSDPQASAIVLPSLLTPGTVLAALDEAGKKRPQAVLRTDPAKPLGVQNL